MDRKQLALAAATTLALACAHTAREEAPAAPESAFTETFGEYLTDFQDAGRNDYFILEPGYTLRFEGKEKGETATLVIRVLDETKEVGGVRTRVVEERETHGAEIEEVSRNFFAISRRTRSVYYFGEEVDTYHGGKVTDHAGSWKHKSGGARYGLMMPAEPVVGAAYYQEFAPEIAMDRARIVSLDEVVQTPAGKFEHCVKTEETTPIEPGSKEYKYYAPGIGLVRDGAFRLVDFGKD